MKKRFIIASILLVAPYPMLFPMDDTSSSSSATPSTHEYETDQLYPTPPNAENIDLFALAKNLENRASASTQDNGYEGSSTLTGPNQFLHQIPQKDQGWLSTTYHYVRKNVAAYSQGELATYGSAILNGTLEQALGIVPNSTNIMFKQTTVGHHADRAVCAAAEFVLKDNDHVIPLFDYLESCRNHKYWLSKTTLMYALTILAYNQKKIYEDTIQYTRLSAHIQTNIGLSKNLTTPNPSEPPLTSVVTSQLNSIREIFSSIAKRINTPLVSISSPQKQSYVKTLLYKTGSEVSRKIQGNEAYCREDLERGTLEKCIKDFTPCPSGKIDQFFQYLVGKTNQPEKEDITKVVTFMRGCVTVDHMADRVVRDIAQKSLDERSRNALTEISYLLGTCNNCHYHLHPYTGALLAHVSSILSSQEPCIPQDFSVANNELLAAINTFCPDNMQHS